MALAVLAVRVVIDLVSSRSVPEVVRFVKGPRLAYNATLCRARYRNSIKKARVGTSA